jgi:DNA segregation ATPase FtsK/SpoIIIE-like protein
MEFGPFEGIPHLYTLPGAPNGICQYREAVPDILRWLLHEGERRIEIIKKAGYKDIGRYNSRNRKHALPHMVLMIDEWADVWLERKLGTTCEVLLTDIASRFRAVGLHVIICTQVPKSEVISTRIKGVLPAKVCFSMTSNTASMLVLDNSNAAGLSPIGRFILQFPPDEIQVQAPFVSDEDVKAIIEGAKSGNYEAVQARSHDVTELEIMTWALANDNGWLAVARLFKQFQTRGITQREILEQVATWEGKEFVIGTSLYRVEPPAGSRARRLVAVDNCEGEAPAEPVT